MYLKLLLKPAAATYLPYPRASHIDREEVHMELICNVAESRTSLTHNCLLLAQHVR